jgi:exodeoxyribonuclease VII large subunit
MIQPRHSTDSALQRRIYTVSELTTSIKVLLESQFPFIWISGEVSNFKKPSSGHFYFTLKDESAQIASVMFRNQNRGVHFELEDGLHILGLGRISVYEPRGSYQIILEYIEPRGIGALQLAFEQLRERLKKEGLFDQDHKKSIPFLPAKISLITSPTGSVVHDILTVINRRYPNMTLEILPVKVQGSGSVQEIVEALESINARMDSDVVIIARGGGSLEDLQAFNSEEIARAIFASKIPVVSAVGHETDFTIADFVADLRAPTPSAAAEMVVPVKSELVLQVSSLKNQLARAMLNHIRDHRTHLKQFLKRLPKPHKTVQDLMLRVDDYNHRISLAITRMIKSHHDKVTWISAALAMQSPIKTGEKLNYKLEQLTYNLKIFIINMIHHKLNTLDQLHGKLNALNPMAVLQRGYSITRTLPKGWVVHDAVEVHLNQVLEILLARGRIIGRVERKITDG